MHRDHEEDPQSWRRYAIRFETPARRWTEALPLGNGSLGAMCFGGLGEDVLQLNDDTFWSGMPSDWDVAGAADAVRRAREKVFEGAHVEAGELLQGAQGTFTESYLPLGDLVLTLGHERGTTDYERSLDLDLGTSRVSYVHEGTTYTRTAFVSATFGVLVLQLDCDHPEGLALTAQLQSPLAVGRPVAAADTMQLMVKAPATVVPSYLESSSPIVRDDRLGHGMFAAMVLGVRTDGQVHSTGEALAVQNASTATLILASATGFRGYASPPDGTPEECAKSAGDKVRQALATSTDHLLEDHLAEHRGWFRRVAIRLESQESRLTLRTPDLIERAASDDEAAVALTELLFQYGRYLLIASSRPGTQAANLQGIWNRDLRPPWSSNYTLNINTQMNYWPAEPAGLPELHQPLIRLIRELADTGSRTARRSYELPGWLAHHNSDLWRHSMAVGDGDFEPKWANWSMGGAWLVHHVWEHYAFSLDTEELRENYPLIRSAAEFLLAWLVERGDELVTAPATSPENSFLTEDGQEAAVTWAPTMDLALIAQVFDDVAAAAEALGIDNGFATMLRSTRQRLRQPRVGSRGQLLEWPEEVADVDPHHRHVSHLVGVFPGDVHADDPVLREAAKVSLDERGDESTGWSRAWKANLWARLGDGERAYKLLRGFCNEVTTEEVTEDGGIYANLLCAHPPFQVDGNLGFTSAVCQMLLDSRLGVIDVLPALPSQWGSGSVRGLRARGGVTVDLAWTDGRLIHATLRPTHAATCRVQYRDLSSTIELSAGLPVRLDGQLLRSPTNEESGHRHARSW
jgi:alpha-L-fucosidase 2